MGLIDHGLMVGAVAGVAQVTACKSRNARGILVMARDGGLMHCGNVTMFGPISQLWMTDKYLGWGKSRRC